jgi:hypothetical protein
MLAESLADWLGGTKVDKKEFQSVETMVVRMDPSMVDTMVDKKVEQ